MYHECMEQNRPRFVTSEEEQKLPLLIVDKQGILGAELAQHLQEQFLIVLVSGRDLDVHENIIHIPYRKKIPLIPDNAYSHIFLVYNGEEELLEMLPSFMKKTMEGNTKLLFITSFLHCTEKLSRRLAHHAYHALQIVVYGELFDNYGLEANIVNSFVHQARVYGKVEIPNSGLGKHHPILLTDVLMAVIATAFSEEKLQRVLLAFPKHSVTEISLARMLQKVNPLLKIDFKKKKNRSIGFSIPEGAYFFPDYPVEEKLRTIDLSKNTAPSVVPIKNMLVHSPRKGTPRFFIVMLSLFLMMCLPLLLTVLFAAVGAGALTHSLSVLEKAKLSDAHQAANIAQFSFQSAETVSHALLPVAVLAPTQIAQLEQNISVGKRISAAEIDILAGAALITDITAGKSLDPKNDFMHALAKVKNALLVLQKMKAEKQLPKEVLAKLDTMHAVLVLFANTSDAYPEIFGFEGKRKYLVLFQNNMELRPGGGFIGSYALFEIENAQIRNFKVYDVYDADGKMKAHIEPPFGLRRYLGASHWFLRDSNFDVDFTKDAELAAQFLQQETGEKVQGVIAVNTTFMRRIISALGSVTVPEYNEKVTANNFYLLTQTHAEKDFFPGSTQKKDFLRALANALFLDLTEKEQIPYRALISKVTESVQRKDLLFSFPDAATQKVFTVNNLSGSLWDGRVVDDKTFPDYLGIVDANVGANKANYYVTKSIKQETTIDDKGDGEATVTVAYTNASKKESPFGGDYKNYVRFILPTNASLQSVVIDGEKMETVPAVTDPGIFTKKSFVPPSGLEVEETTQEGKSLVGFFLIVPVQSTKTVVIRYTLAHIVNTEETAFSYDLSLFKQSGTGDDPYSFFLTYPTSFLPVALSEGLTNVGGKLTYFTTLSEDKQIQATFSQK